MPPSAGVYLQSYLAGLSTLIARDDVTDIYVNRPREIWVETLGGAIERHDAPTLDAKVLSRLSQQVAALSHQGISREHPILSANLPDGSRIQIVAPPAAHHHLALAIRKHVNADLSLAYYAAQGAFARTVTETASVNASDTAIAARLAERDFAGALALAVRSRKNILVSGGTSTGKTTFLNALIAEIARDERLITIEDTPELAVSHSNAVRLLAVRGALGESHVSADDLVTASLRMRPDRLILGELRGPEAFAFLRAVNTGHPGSMTTIHADSAAGAIEQIAMLILQSGTRLSRQDVGDYVRQSVDLFIQLERHGGRRYVSEVIRSDAVGLC